MRKVYLVRIGKPSVSIKLIDEPDGLEHSIAEYKSLFNGLIQIDAIGWFFWNAGLRRLAVMFKV